MNLLWLTIPYYFINLIFILIFAHRHLNQNFGLNFIIIFSLRLLKQFNLNQYFKITTKLFKVIHFTYKMDISKMNLDNLDKAIKNL